LQTILMFGASGLSRNETYSLPITAEKSISADGVIVSLIVFHPSRGFLLLFAVHRLQAEGFAQGDFQ